MYKINYRVITTRFHLVLKKIIDDHQSVFILERLITNNILAGFECMHWIRNNSMGNTRHDELNGHEQKHMIMW